MRLPSQLPQPSNRASNVAPARQHLLLQRSSNAVRALRSGAVDVGKTARLVGIQASATLGLATALAPASQACLRAARPDHLRLVLLLAGPGGWGALACQAALTGSVVAIALWAATRTPQQQDGKIGVVLTHTVPVLSLACAWAPILGHSAVRSMPVLGPAALCSAALLSCTARWQRKVSKPSPLSAARAWSVALSIVPMTWGAAAGADPRWAVMHGLGLAAWSLCATAVAYAIARTAQQNAPTPYIDNIAIPPAYLQKARLDQGLAAPAPHLPAHISGRATIFNTPAGLANMVHQLQAARGALDSPFNGFRGQPIAHFYGPPGGGKTLSTRGVAQALNGWQIRCSADHIQADAVDGLPIAALNTVTALLQADSLGRREKKPVVLLLDEIDAMLPPLDAPRTAENVNQGLGYLLLLHTLQLLARQRSHVVIFTATNQYKAVAPLLQPMSRRAPIFVAPPPHAEMRQMLVGLLETLHDELALALGDANPPWRVDEAHMDALLQACAEHGGLSGRNTKALIRAAQRCVISLARSPQAGDPVGLEATTDEVFTQMKDAIARLPKVAKRPAKPPRNNNAVLHPAQLTYEDFQTAAADDELLSLTSDEGSTDGDASDSVDKDEQPHGDAAALHSEHAQLLMRRLGLQNLDPLEVTERLLRSLAHAYVDPSNNLRVAMLKARFAGTLAQLVSLYTQATWGACEATEFDDVPSIKHLRVFSAGENQQGLHLGKLFKAGQASMLLRVQALWRNLESHAAPQAQPSAQIKRNLLSPAPASQKPKPTWPKFSRRRTAAI